MEPDEVDGLVAAIVVPGSQPVNGFFIAFHNADGWKKTYPLERDPWRMAWEWLTFRGADWSEIPLDRLKFCRELGDGSQEELDPPWPGGDWKPADWRHQPWPLMRPHLAYA